MNTITLFKEKLSKVLFFEVNLEIVEKLFNYSSKEELFFPIRSSTVLEEIKKENDFKNINLAYFFEGMAYVIGCDSSFKYNKEYINIIKRNSVAIKCIKKSILDLLKREEDMDAYIILKGLYLIEESEEVYSKAMTTLDSIRLRDKDFEEEELKMIALGKNNDCSIAYYYDSILYYHREEYDNALISLNLYFEKEKNIDNSIYNYKKELELLSNYKKGKENVYDNPAEALKYLLPLVDEFENNAVLYFYIAVSYRIIKNYEKAIYYLNEAFSIDNQLVDVVNELGLNYACLGHYDIAVNYFKKVFEASNAIEPCTNLIMCYMHIKDLKKANYYLNLGKQIEPEDDILKELEEKLLGGTTWN